MYNPPIIEDELNIILDEIIEGKFEIELNTQTYDDVKEEII
jgi:hypothetical protein